MSASSDGFNRHCPTIHVPPGSVGGVVPRRVAESIQTGAPVCVAYAIRSVGSAGGVAALMLITSISGVHASSVSATAASLDGNVAFAQRSSRHVR